MKGHFMKTRRLATPFERIAGRFPRDLGRLRLDFLEIGDVAVGFDVRF